MEKKDVVEKIHKHLETVINSKIMEERFKKKTEYSGGYIDGLRDAWKMVGRFKDKELKEELPDFWKQGKPVEKK